ncbi:MAG TPA: hypothetical protein ENI23_12700 [bacterium]|nr:hypothetical protein [bacterium]
MDEENTSYEEYSTALEQEVRKLQDKNTELSGSISSSAHAGHKDSNLIALQLETPELLQKLERFYRGEYLHTDEEGNVTWKLPENKDLIPLNEFGVSLLMEVVTKYIDKNTVLSNYTEERIYEIIGDIGDELILVVYCNYEKMGMDSAFKKTKFRLLITTTLHLIESSYRRAIGGETFQKLNESRIVTQSDALNRGVPQILSQKKRFSPIDPRTWGSR